MKSNRIQKILLSALVSTVITIVLLALVAYITNRSIQINPETNDSLADVDKTRLSEALHLKAELGDAVWDGLGKMDYPVVLWHSGNSFLFGAKAKPTGWEKVPNDLFQGEPYYRNPDFEPENFAILIGDQWIASMATKGETDLFLQGVFRDVIPDPLEPVFPFRLLILNTEFQISGVIHESFHVYQATLVPEKFSQANATYQKIGDYWKIDKKMRSEWEKEVGILVDANSVTTNEKVVSLAKEYLTIRNQRRSDHGLTLEQINFEKQIEWLEGLAKYVELSIWETANNNDQYNPVSGIHLDPDFKEYQTFSRHWDMELNQAREQASIEGDVRFYYSGMLQARLLDRLLPDWKTQIMADDVYLEDLLATAIDH
jgi:hypothetical protein